VSDVNGSIEGVRQRNLARVLRLVHIDGPLSRAALTEATKLNRSTIADLVGELAGLGLVEERNPEAARRVGRPSPIVAARGDVVAIAVNPEVDAVTIAAVGLDRTIALRERIEMDHVATAVETVDLVAERLASWRRRDLKQARVVAVGVAVPGLVRASDGVVRNAPHLGWIDVSLRDAVAAATGLPTAVDNDASLGVVAEQLFGAARDVEHVVYLNGGASGIGGGLIVHGMPVTGAGGYAGEFGQNRPAAGDDRRVENGVLEDEVSRRRLLEALDVASADEPTLAELLAESDDPAVAEEVSRQRRILATALANAINALNPAVVVLGGFLATLAERDLVEFEATVRAQAMRASAEDVVIRTAVLAEDRLLIGAAEAAFADLLRDPVG